MAIMWIRVYADLAKYYSWALSEKLLALTELNVSFSSMDISEPGGAITIIQDRPSRIPRYGLFAFH